MKSGTARTTLFKEIIRAHSRYSRATCKLTTLVKKLVPKTSSYEFAMQRLGLSAPIAMEDNKPVIGKVRAEFSTREPATRLSITRDHGSYAPTDRGSARPC